MAWVNTLVCLSQDIVHKTRRGSKIDQYFDQHVVIAPIYLTAVLLRLHQASQRLRNGAAAALVDSKSTSDPEKKENIFLKIQNSIRHFPQIKHAMGLPCLFVLACIGRM